VEEVGASLHLLASTGVVFGFSRTDRLSARLSQSRVDSARAISRCLTL
jgi:hypothetical protein